MNSWICLHVGTLAWAVGDWGVRNGGGSSWRHRRATREDRRAFSPCVLPAQAMAAVSGPGPLLGALAGGGGWGRNVTCAGSLTGWQGLAAALLGHPGVPVTEADSCDPSSRGSGARGSDDGQPSPLLAGAARPGGTLEAGEGQSRSPLPPPPALSCKPEAARQGIGPGYHWPGLTLSHHPCARAATRDGGPKPFSRPRWTQGLLLSRWLSQALPLLPFTFIYAILYFVFSQFTTRVSVSFALTHNEI